ncbi:alpha-L-arabinofuranosidase [Bacteroidales bacterium]|nr:alpha-L-arabinofuranosidase [Bacteroidales bacterium]
MKKTLFIFWVFILSFSTSFAQYEVQVETKKPTTNIQSDMYGIFFEDINFGADGGLYAELVKNRSFDFTNSPLMGWNTYGLVSVQNQGGPFDRNPHYVKLTNKYELLTGTGLINEGFKGIGVKEGENYRFSFYARSKENKSMKIAAELIDSKNNPVGKIEVEVYGKEWKKYQGLLTAKLSDAHCQLNVSLQSLGEVDLEHISLFPSKTWKSRENGMREDIAQALADLKPGFFRFPGGCIVEGNNLATRYQWKNTIGPVENRPVNENRWNYEFKHKFFPDYFQSYGLGFFEYFELCEDFSSEPLPVLSCGFSCQFQKGREEIVPLDSLQAYIDDALDLIEFANGSASSRWGKIRAEMGHPAPFNMKYLAIGNEQWGPLYHIYLEAFVKQIRKKYPEIKIIGGSGPDSEGAEFERLWPQMKSLKVDLVDEHFYRSTDWFLNAATRYDNYDRKGPKVFAGEYACHTSPVKKNNFESALAEAAFLTGVERNADVVHLAAYAPLLAHVDAWQWNPNLIWFDNMRLVKSPNYYVQQLYSHYMGTDVLKTSLKGKPLAGQDGIYASSVIDKNKGQIIIKVVNTSTSEKDLVFSLIDYKQSKSQAKIISLKAEMDAENTLDNPFAIVPKEEILSIKDNKLNLKIEAQSFVVLVY